MFPLLLLNVLLSRPSHLLAVLQVDETIRYYYYYYYYLKTPLFEKETMKEIT